MTGKLCDKAFVANLVGGVLAVIGILGFVPNALVGPNGFFVAGMAHNLVHLASGIALVLSARVGHTKEGLVAVGAIYVVIAVLGYVTAGGAAATAMPMNAADHLLHLVLGVVLLASGLSDSVCKKKK